MSLPVLGAARRIFRRLLRWLQPGGFVLGIAAALVAWAPPEVTTQTIRGYPWVAVAAAFFLGWVFHRSRISFAALGVASALWLEGSESAPGGMLVAGMAFAVLVAALALTRDRGLTSPGGLLQGAVAALVLLPTTLMVPAHPSLVTRVVQGQPFGVAFTGWTGLPQGVALVLAGAALTTLYALFRWRGPAEKGLFWSLAAITIATHPQAPPPVSRMFLLAAAVILGLSVLELSYAMAYRDDLTGLPARRALLRDLETLGGQYTAAMIDVDHFKKFNDRHGHDVGDQVLRMVAGRLARTPGGAKAYRYGGEEFALLFPGRSREDAIPHVETVRRAIEQAAFSLRARSRPRRRRPGTGTLAKSKKTVKVGRRLSVTVSAGVAASKSADEAPAQVLKRADKALYRAKRAGRNRVAT